MFSHMKVPVVVAMLFAAVATRSYSQEPRGSDQRPYDVAQFQQTLQQLQERVAELEKKLAALNPLLREFEERQKYLMEVEEIGRFPANIQPTGTPVVDPTTLAPGKVLQAQKEGLWWAAEVAAVLPDRNVKVHYLGWPPEWDEIVPISRLQLDPDAKKKAHQMAVSKATLALPAGPGPVSPSGIAVDAKSELSVNERLIVEWGKKWWSGSVVELLPDGAVKIHYSGWDAQWDEVVPRSRLQLPRSDG